ncbi:hypothetical protein LOY67_17380 [Pseudomonas sp. B21-056]|jgi:hypothetical protein|uniref:hypothetical protein n=1 Tax=Pseudomonas sp. B21-056 TaxID=2895495 RepID=UPI0022316FA4|nr:hypothetical protein [Pseudomonas sp. B21-056]UZE21818.1 hypothetical protein LOY67_17380 [Pseudomonas sp. B21-056]
MSLSLNASIEALQDAVWAELPTMSWADAMKHVSTVLEHVHRPSVPAEHLSAASAAIAESRFYDAGRHLRRALIALDIRTGERVVRQAELLDAFDQAHAVMPFLWLEIGYNRVSDWAVTVYDKAGGTERVVVQSSGLGADETCGRAAQQLRQLLEEKTNDQ